MKSERLPIITRLETSLDLEGREWKGKRSGPVLPAKNRAMQMYFDWRSITQIPCCRNEIRAPRDGAWKKRGVGGEPAYRPITMIDKAVYCLWSAVWLSIPVA